MASCDELESAILDRVAGTLAPAEAAALQVHLDGCPRCRAWQSSCVEAVRLASLPEPSEAELKIFAHLPARARAEFRERSRSSRWGRVLIATALGGAALASLLLVVTPRMGSGRDTLFAAAEEPDESELVAWALSDPLEDQELTAFADEGLDDESVEPGEASELDLEWEQTE
jgi:anti-sigma factor RsiW